MIRSKRGAAIARHPIAPHPMPAHTLRLPQPAPNDLPRGLAIVTKYAGPTYSKGSRVLASCQRDSETTHRAAVSYNPAADCLQNHYEAALAVLRKIEANNEWFSFRIQAVASTPTGYVFTTEALSSSTAA